MVITNKHIEDAYKALATKPKDPNAIVAPSSDESVWGYPTDQQPKCNGVDETKEVVDNIGAAEIPP